MGGAFCHRRSCAALIAASMTRRVFMAEKRTANACCSTRGTCDTRLLFDPIDLDVDALADLAAVTGAGSEQLARVLGGLRFDAPLLHAGDVHRGMEGLEHGPLFESGNSHELLRDESVLQRSLTERAGENKSATQTCHGSKRLHGGAGTG